MRDGRDFERDIASFILSHGVGKRMINSTHHPNRYEGNRPRDCITIVLIHSTACSSTFRHFSITKASVSSSSSFSHIYVVPRYMCPQGIQCAPRSTCMYFKIYELASHIGYAASYMTFFARQISWDACGTCENGRNGRWLSRILCLAPNHRWGKSSLHVILSRGRRSSVLSGASRTLFASDLPSSWFEKKDFRGKDKIFSIYRSLTDQKFPRMCILRCLIVMATELTTRAVYIDRFPNEMNDH